MAKTANLINICADYWHFPELNENFKIKVIGKIQLLNGNKGNNK